LNSYDKYNNKPEKFGPEIEQCLAVRNYYLKTSDENLEGGRYTDAIYGTKQYYDFWDDQKKKCLYGMFITNEEGDRIFISGFHYFYLNYCLIRVINSYIDPETGEEISERKASFPDFHDGDWEYFMAVDLAIKTGKHLTVLKARRKGFSYKAAAMLCRNYFLKRGSKGFVFAAEKEFLLGDGMLTKTWEIMAFIDKNTAWTQPRLKNSEIHKRSGFKEYINGAEVDSGFLSEIMGVTLKHDVQKVRGKAGELIFFEEAGKFPGLAQAWEITWPTITQGNKTLGLMVAFGTGGTEGANFESLEAMFRSPKAYHCLEVENVWEDAGGTSGWFVPDYQNLEGYMDEYGNSDKKKAIEFRLTTREDKKTANDPKALDLHIAEHPFTPSEAVLQIDTNQFPVQALLEQYNKVISKNWQHFGVAGLLHETEKGIVFKPDGDRKPIFKFPHRKAKDVDLKSAVVVYQPPFRDDNNRTPAGLYIICHDPYGQNQSLDSTSLGAAYVIKRVNRFSSPDDIIVASWVARPEFMDDYNEQLFMLAEYYNAKIGFENDRGEVIPYAKRFRKLQYLEEEFEMLDKRELQSEVKRGYGMHMSEARKAQGELYLRDWLKMPRGVDEDGNKVMNLHKIYDPALLQELIKFNPKQGNFDRVLAMMIGMFHLKELYNAQPVENTDDVTADEFFDRDFY
jgi:hypothetical protein